MKRCSPLPQSLFNQFLDDISLADPDVAVMARDVTDMRRRVLFLHAPPCYAHAVLKVTVKLVDPYP